jgi:hypothetical protein
MTDRRLLVAGLAVVFALSLVGGYGTYGLLEDTEHVSVAVNASGFTGPPPVPGQQGQVPPPSAPGQQGQAPPDPTLTPTPDPTPEPTLTPTPEPTPDPTLTPTPEPTQSQQSIDGVYPGGRE